MIVAESRMSPASPIKLLPEHLIDQIKAGEVVERPASLIKEILENSLDAGASKIDIHLIDNGMELISIEDNGAGMTFDDLPFAFCRHATSKIERFEDLYKLHSFGFRGEALASISSIARITCDTRPKDQSLKGGRIVIHGGEQKSLIPHDGGQVGTSLFIKDLFYNTPVRLKFIKSKNSEKIALKRMIHSFILAHPTVSFSIKWDDKEKIFFNKMEKDFSQRVKKVLFSNKKEGTSLISFDSEYEGHRVHGYLSLASFKGNSGKGQFLFANKRIFHDKAIHQAVIRAGEKIWPMGERGNYVVFIDAPPSAIDVNVHPNKTYIKFFKSGVVFSLIQAAIQKVLVNRVISSEGHEQRELRSESFTFNDAREFDFSSHSLPPSGRDRTGTPQSFIERSIQRVSRCLKLTQRFFIYQRENSSYLGDLQFLQQNLFKNIFKKGEVLKDSHVLPLLISEPFNLKPSRQLENWLEFLKSYGFEFERLEEDLVVLRTIPEILGGLPIKAILEPLIQTLSHCQDSPSVEQSIDLITKIPLLHLQECYLQTLLDPETLESLIKNRTITVLDDQILGDIR